VPVDELYHVSNTGIAGGFGRALVLANFPTALAAIAVDLALFGLLAGRRERLVAVLSILLCAVVAWPGVVEQSDLDPKPVNAIPALGVALALALTALVGRRSGLGRFGRAGAWWRAAIAAIAVVVALPWLAADLGFYLGRVPLLGRLFLTGDLRTQPGDPVPHPAVHHGHHHGMDGTLLALTALLLIPVVIELSGARRVALAGYVSLMFCYGVGNSANDAWLEQVVKRGWTAWEIPGVTTPKANGGWLVILAAAIVIWAAWLRILADDRSRRLTHMPAAHD
jgi:hypothetical protein